MKTFPFMLALLAMNGQPESPAVFPSDLPATLPHFPGGQEALGTFIRHTARYPKKARELGAEELVLVKFVADRYGNVRNARLIKSVGYGLDEEALREDP